ncbi:nitroreductase family protein [Alistipes sp.]|uniref:nitroreductase family protein n=1 Tax=Alistipes sp. TaxID=1872444 RepID=UPI0025C388C9|nr:nitroreductase family protein [Alistipes sp.]
MNLKCLTCAALLFAACGGPGQTGKENPGKVESRTEVAYGERIALLPVEEQGGLTINEALQNRRSWREYNPGDLSLEELSGVLWAAAGENRPSEGRLTAPSALALYPVRVYAVFAEGAYLYDAKAHALTRVAEGDLRKLSGAQEFVFSAPLNLLYVADLSAYEGRGIPADKVRYLCGQDAAGYAENVNLYTAGHGLRSITRGSAPEAELLAALGLDTDRFFLALAQTVGR